MQKDDVSTAGDAHYTRFQNQGMNTPLKTPKTPAAVFPRSPKRITSEQMDAHPSQETGRVHSPTKQDAVASQGKRHKVSVFRTGILLSRELKVKEQCESKSNPLNLTLVESTQPEEPHAVDENMTTSAAASKPAASHSEWSSSSNKTAPLSASTEKPVTITEPTEAQQMAEHNSKQPKCLPKLASSARSKTPQPKTPLLGLRRSSRRRCAVDDDDDGNKIAARSSPSNPQADCSQDFDYQPDPTTAQPLSTEDRVSVSTSRNPSAKKVPLSIGTKVRKSNPSEFGAGNGLTIGSATYKTRRKRRAPPVLKFSHITETPSRRPGHGSVMRSSAPASVPTSHKTQRSDFSSKTQSKETKKERELAREGVVPKPPVTPVEYHIPSRKKCSFVAESDKDPAEVRNTKLLSSAQEDSSPEKSQSSVHSPQPGQHAVESSGEQSTDSESTGEEPRVQEEVTPHPPTEGCAVEPDFMPEFEELEHKEEDVHSDTEVEEGEGDSQLEQEEHNTIGDCIGSDADASEEEDVDETGDTRVESDTEFSHFQKEKLTSPVSRLHLPPSRASSGMELEDVTQSLLSNSSGEDAEEISVILKVRSKPHFCLP